MASETNSFLTQDELDELVIESKCVEASNINNQGAAVQLEYLRSVGVVE